MFEAKAILRCYPFLIIPRWMSIVGAATIQALVARVGRHPFGFLLIIAEPIALTFVFGLVYAYLDRRPVFGPDQLLFHATGVIPFYWFIRVCTRTRNMELDSPQRFPIIKPLDSFCAQLAVECTVMTFATVIVFGGIAALGTPDAIPFAPVQCASAVFWIAVFGAGLGLVSAVIGDFVSFWPGLMAVATRGLMLISGVFQVLDFMPPTVRDVLTWNPIAQGINWFRTGILFGYPTYTLNRQYLMTAALGVLALGLAVERATRRSRGDVL